MIWFDLFCLQSPQLVEHSCSARMNGDLNKVIIIIIMGTQLNEEQNKGERRGGLSGGRIFVSLIYWKLKWT